MALTTPVLDESVKIAFDASQEKEIKFNVIGGDQVYYNQISVRNVTTNAVVYTHTADAGTYRYVNTIPEETLENGVQYAIKVRTYNEANEHSSWSQEITFYCYTTPTVSIPNIPSYEGVKTVNNATFYFECVYSQIENELPNRARWQLYKEIRVEDTFVYKLIKEAETKFKLEEGVEHTLFKNSGLSDSTRYKIKAIVFTVEGTQVETSEVEFIVRYNNPIFRSELKLINNCYDGYVSVSTNAYIAEGKSNPTPPLYFEDETDYGSLYSIDSAGCNPVLNYTNNYNRWIRWNTGFTIPNNFILKYWFTVGSVNNDIMNIVNSETNDYIKIRLYRGETYDYVQLTSSEGTCIVSNTITHTNSNDQLYLWMKLKDGAITLKLSVLNRDTTDWTINGLNSNVYWNHTTDKLWEEESIDYINPSSVSEIPIINTYDDLFIGNAVCRRFLINMDTTSDYDEEFDSWSDDILLRCDFQNNINAGNVESTLAGLTGIAIKRKDTEDDNWITLLRKKIEKIEDLEINYKDSFVPNDKLQEYAIVPLLQDGIEGSFIKSNITPKFDGVFISDRNKIFKLYSGVVYGNTTQNKPTGIINTIGRKYPIVIQNSENNYKTGGVSGKLLGYNYETSHFVDKRDVVKQANDILEFLTDGNAKMIRDWNGNIFMVRITDSPSVSYDSNLANSVANVQFSWVEQGQYNNERDLLDNGLSEDETEELIYTEFSLWEEDPSVDTYEQIEINPMS